jgi:hypothetical protein
MAKENYGRDRAGLLFVDPYNDFLSDGGKLWPWVELVKAIEDWNASVATGEIIQRMAPRIVFGGEPAGSSHARWGPLRRA